MTLIVWMCSGNGQHSPQPIYLMDPRWPAQYHQVLPCPHDISFFASIYDSAYNLLQKAQSPSFLLHLRFSVLSETVMISGAWCYIASEKLVTLKTCHLWWWWWWGYSFGYKRRFIKLLLFILSFLPSLRLGVYIRCWIHSGTLPCITLERVSAAETGAFCGINLELCLDLKSLLCLSEM